jgi:hypothetical protein
MCIVQELSVETAILSDPSQMPQEALNDIAARSAKKEETSPR